MRDAWLFLKEFAADPGRVGAVAPSSPALAEAMVRAADIRPGMCVAELGAGTGPFTRAIRTAHPGVPLLALEPGEKLAAVLRDRHPDVEIVERLAVDLPDAVRAWGHDHVDRVVSGLPWALFPPEVQDASLDAIARALTDDGRFVTFQYVHSQVLPKARRLAKVFHQFFHEVDRTKATWRNMPPAFVFVCDRPRR